MISPSRDRPGEGEEGGRESHSAIDQDVVSIFLSLDSTPSTQSDSNNLKPGWLVMIVDDSLIPFYPAILSSLCSWLGVGVSARATRRDDECGCRSCRNKYSFSRSVHSPCFCCNRSVVAFRSWVALLVHK